MKWVDFVFYDLNDQNTVVGTVVAQARLEGSAVNLHGSDAWLAAIERGVRGRAQAADGEPYLHALSAIFLGSRFVATGVREGHEPTTIGSELPIHWVDVP